MNKKQISRISRALSSEVRVQIIWILASCKDGCHVGLMCQMIDLSQNALSHHLVELQNAGLVDRVQRGRFAIYTFNNSGLESYIAQVNNLLKGDTNEAQGHEVSAS